MRRICIIPARGGSQRIPRKNIRLFHGKPIIAYSIETAKASKLFDQIFVSTDDDEIASVAEKYGALILKRPVMLDECGTQEVMRQALRSVSTNEWGVACCLYATAPMLKKETLKEAFYLLSHTITAYVVPVGTWLNDPGQFYIGTISAFMEGIDLRDCSLVPIDPATECDINTEEDWVRAEQMYANLKGLK